ncbi:hypothetical protein EK21DRAFT_119097 [Setomelanomma holmii]|uniref:Uncharacterized protein n=1 Tax=Setomelanomma holmii TaxID=210430 RepID=A0A9P4LEB6_9PLEO|nr:hypothetical protein EK21DRAFT_119097 [Setomelanomma holmii]
MAKGLPVPSQRPLTHSLGLAQLALALVEVAKIIDRVVPSQRLPVNLLGFAQLALIEDPVPHVPLQGPLKHLLGLAQLASVLIESAHKMYSTDFSLYALVGAFMATVPDIPTAHSRSTNRSINLGS